MTSFFTQFSDSAKEFKNLKSIVVAALLVALHTVMALFLSIQVTGTLRISISFLANIMVGYMFGPVMGLVCGGLGDIVQFVIKPTGTYFFGWTLNAALAGFIYGCFFYRKAPKKIYFSGAKLNDVNQDSRRTHNMLIDAASVIAVVVGMIFVFVAEFIVVTDKTTGEIVTNGTAFSQITGALNGGVFGSGAILSCLLIIGGIVAILGVIFKFNHIALSVEVVLGFVSILAVYTDKKTTTVGMGFILIVAMAFVYGVLQLIKLCLKNTVDTPFMIRCVLVLIFDTVLVNIFLGTYWCTVMYGKGFAVYFTSRLVKNLVQLPVNVILTYYMLGIIGNLKLVRRIGSNNK